MNTSASAIQTVDNGAADVVTTAATIATAGHDIRIRKRSATAGVCTAGGTADIPRTEDLNVFAIVVSAPKARNSADIDKTCLTAHVVSLSTLHSADAVKSSHAARLESFTMHNSVSTAIWRPTATTNDGAWV